MRAVMLAAAVALSCGSAVAAQKEGPVEVPGQAWVLVQSELDYLERASERLSIDFRGLAPATALAKLGEQVRLRVETPEPLPAEPKLTAAFQDATVKEILHWFAEEVGVSYRVDGPSRLRVLVRPKASQPG